MNESGYLNHVYINTKVYTEDGTILYDNERDNCYEYEDDDAGKYL